MRTTIASGGPGTRQLSGFGRWIFQGFRLADGGVVLVNRGFVPEKPPRARSSRRRDLQPSRASCARRRRARVHASRPAGAARILHPRPRGDRRLARAWAGRAVLSRSRAAGDGLTPPAGVAPTGADRPHPRQPSAICADLVRAGADAARRVRRLCVAVPKAPATAERRRPAADLCPPRPQPGL